MDDVYIMDEINKPVRSQMAVKQHHRDSANPAISCNLGLTSKVAVQ